MTMNYQPPSLIGATNATVANPFMPPLKFARAARDRDWETVIIYH